MTRWISRFGADGPMQGRPPAQNDIFRDAQLGHELQFLVDDRDTGVTSVQRISEPDGRPEQANVASVDAYARRISSTAHADFVLDAPERALHDRRPANRGARIHHSDRGSQYVGIKHTERLADAGIEPFVGSVGAVWALST